MLTGTVFVGIGSECCGVYPLLVPGTMLAAAIISALAWPVAAVVAITLLRRELAGTFRRIQSLEFPGGKATFAALADYERVIATAAGDGASAPDAAIVRRGETEFGVLDALAEVAPQQAVIDAWGLLEYQLNVASDRVAPDQPHGWPQVARNLETWDKWPMLYPAVLELRRLRDSTVRSSRSPSSSDALRYVSVAQDLVTTLRTAQVPRSDGDPGGEDE
jgi:hypothetical protein